MKPSFQHKSIIKRKSLSAALKQEEYSNAQSSKQRKKKKKKHSIYKFLELGQYCKYFEKIKEHNLTNY